MEYCLEKFYYPSSDGINNVAGYVYIPFAESYKGIVQISHGMCEYFMRYEKFCEYLACRGFIVCGNDHIGHGHSADSVADLGYTAEKDGADILASDVHMLSAIIKERFPRLPHILLGHSMGSLIARYCISLYPDMTDSCIIMGTVGLGKAASLASVAKGLAKTNIKMFGDRNKSAFLKSLVFGGYNNPPKKLKSSEQTKEDKEGKEEKKVSAFSWLSTDENEVAKYEADNLAGFDFTSRGYYDLFDLISKVSTKAWAESLDKELPVLVTSGVLDPVGGYGIDVWKLCEMMHEAGMVNLRHKFYRNSRHEILNDVEREKVTADLYSWISGICEKMLSENENA